MGKVVDITEKLSFDDNPKIKIKSVEYEVNSDAPTMLKVMQLLGNGGEDSPNAVVSMYNLIFGENERKKIDKLKLQFKDFQTLVTAAIELVTGESEVGE